MSHKPPKHWRFLAAGLAFALSAAACSSGSGSANNGSSDNGNSGDGNSTDIDSGDIVLTAALQTVNSCDDLLARLKADGLEHVGAYGFDNNGGVFFGDDVMEEMATDDAMSDSAESAPVARASSEAGADRDSGGSSNFSGTNNQEQQVDEADLVKTDGKRLVSVSNGYLHVVDVSGATPELVDEIKLPEGLWEGELFLNGDTALLMSSGWTEVPFSSDAASTTWFPGSPTGRLIEIDLAKGAISRTFEFEGAYLSAREIDGNIRIALSASTARFDFVFPSRSGAEDRAIEANKDLIRESTIEQWIPTYRIIEGGANSDKIVEEGPIVDCDRVFVPSEYAGFGSLVMLTADINDGLQLKDSVSVMTNAQTVYASTDRVVVATPRHPDVDPETGEFKDDDESYRTALHTFDISDPDRADYVASGSVKGHLLNQYSLSEHEGYLRVATTDTPPWSMREDEGTQSESFVIVLEESDGELRQVGKSVDWDSVNKSSPSVSSAISATS